MGNPPAGPERERSLLSFVRMPRASNEPAALFRRLDYQLKMGFPRTSPRNLRNFHGINHPFRQHADDIVQGKFAVAWRKPLMQGFLHILARPDQGHIADLEIADQFRLHPDQLFGPVTNWTSLQAAARQAEGGESAS